MDIKKMLAEGGGQKMKLIDSRTVTIVCPGCCTAQEATETLFDVDPRWCYAHECDCGYIITESEWQYADPDLEAARAWAALWKRAAKRERARLHTSAYLAAKYIVQNAKARRRVEELEAACGNVLELLETMGEDFTKYRNISYPADLVDAPIAQAKHDLRKLLEAPDDET